MRRTRTVTITAAGRDSGKQFLLTEMSAAEAEEIAIRVLGPRFPDAVMTYGMAGVAILGIPAIYAMPYDEAKPLWDRIMACVRPVGTQAAPAPISADNAIEEVTTRIQLRMEVLELHLGFSLADARRVLSDMVPTAPATTENTPMSQDPSGSASAAS